MKIRQVTLVIPPSVFLADERVFMPIGILRVAASVEAAGYDCRIIDLSGLVNYEDVIAQDCVLNKTDIFGITCTTPQLPAAVKIIHSIKRILPSIPIILGGPHATLTYAASRKEFKNGYLGRATAAFKSLTKLSDIIIVGDGEFAILDVLNRPSSRVIDADDPNSIFFLDNAKIESLPLPARHLIDVQSYDFNMNGHKGISLIAQLGCPFECGFCAGRSSPTFRRVRYRSAASVVYEIQHLQSEYGYRSFMFYDDELNVNLEFSTLLLELIKLQDKLGVQLYFRGCVKAELLNQTQAQMMYEAGFRNVLVGAESGSDRILKNINKKATVADNSRCLDIARANGIRVKSLMSIGHPGECPKTIEDTYNWLVTYAPDDFDVSIITILPGTPYYDESLPSESYTNVWTYIARKSGDTLHSFDIDYSVTASYYKGAIDKEYESFVFTDALTPKEIVSAREFLERTLRRKLNIPYPQSRAAILYDHSMGQIPVNAK